MAYCKSTKQFKNSGNKNNNKDIDRGTTKRGAHAASPGLPPATRPAVDSGRLVSSSRSPHERSSDYTSKHDEQTKKNTRRTNVNRHKFHHVHHKQGAHATARASHRPRFRRLTRGGWATKPLAAHALKGAGRARNGARAG